jgi:hypothetical protein
MRKMGGSIGISAVTTLLARRQQLHQDYLARKTFQYNPGRDGALTARCNAFRPIRVKYTES